MSHKVGIIGCGLIGAKRAAALKQCTQSQLCAVVDVDLPKAQALAQKYNAQAYANWEEVVERTDIDIVIVATVNNFLMPITVGALKNNKHVLCEKPLGRNLQESQQIVDAAKNANRLLMTGFNHRYHPAVSKAKELVVEGAIGKLIFLRCRYGHGGRPGYETEWRMDKELSGGGELLDQGVHVVDLFRYLAGDFDSVFGVLSSAVWSSEVEDNAFATFTRQDGVIANMHTSWTQWKNLFSLEIFGHDGYLVINGLGGSYGTESLTIGTRNKNGGTPQEKVLEFPGEDQSWTKQWGDFLEKIDNPDSFVRIAEEGLQASRMLDAVYRSAQEKQIITITQSLNAAYTKA